MSYFNKAEIDEFYNMISNLIDRETFDTMVSENGSRQIGSYLAKGSVASKINLEQLQAINDHKWANMFIDGIAHISWQNGVVTNIFDSFLDEHEWNRQTKVDQYVETWFTTKYFWYYKPGCDVAIKEEYRYPNMIGSGSGSYTHTYSFHPIEEMPKVPEMIVIAMGQRNGRVWIVDQFCGSKNECDLWADKMLKKSGVFVRFVEFDNNRK